MSTKEWNHANGFLADSGFVGGIESLVGPRSFPCLVDRSLAKYQESDGRVNYKKLKSDCDTDKGHVLRVYLASLSTVKKAEFDGWTKPVQMAYLINAYNAQTLKLVIDHYPVKSIKDIGGFFKSTWSIPFFSLLEGAATSLDSIEREWLLAKYKDYRVLAAVNSASLSSPRLQHVAFDGGKLNEQLDSAFREFVNDKSQNSFDANRGLGRCPKIFDWFKKDFEAGGGMARVFEKYDRPRLEDPSDPTPT